jgi:hypothetical protein
MRQADRIFVVELGVIVESGSYDSLLSQRGRFSKCWGSWLIMDEGGVPVLLYCTHILPTINWPLKPSLLATSWDSCSLEIPMHAHSAIVS